MRRWRFRSRSKDPALKQPALKQPALKQFVGKEGVANLIPCGALRDWAAESSIEALGRPFLHGADADQPFSSWPVGDQGQPPYLHGPFERQ